MAIAGGDAVTGHINAFSGKNGAYSFHFTQLEGDAELITGCSSFDVRVEFALASGTADLLGRSPHRGYR
jgi:hypothetical protein